MSKLNTNGKNKNMQLTNRLAGNLFPERLGCLVIGRKKKSLLLTAFTKLDFPGDLSFGNKI